MCGICGVYNFSGSFENEKPLKKMLNKMIHRGPDDEGIYQSGPVGLAMRRLAIIDTSGGHQPIANEDGSIWVISNGEIYNYVELREELEKKGHRFRTSSDTEVLVHLYEEEGIEAVNQLNGMFAFAIYDSKKSALWIVRDRLGIKPLFYSHQADAFMFSSDLAALNAVTQSHTINEDAFVSYLAFAYVSANKTIVNNIHKVPPGHWVWVDTKGVKVKKYWDIQNFQTWQGSVEQAQSELDSLLDNAIRMQLRSDVPVGISLSGGMDSSAIAAYARKHTDNLTTFTVNFIGKSSADVLFSRELAASLRTTHIEVPFAAADMGQHLNELIPFIDEPISDSAVISSYLIAKKAQEFGIKVLLSGAGGDEIFGGYHRHHAPVFGSTQWLAENTPKYLNFFTRQLMKLINRDKSLRMKNPMIAFGAGFSGANLAVLLEIFKDKSIFAKLTQTFTHELDLSEQTKSYSYARMYTDLKHYLVDDILSLGDKTTMATSVEGRVPLLDHNLVEFAFSLPESINLLQKSAKGLFRKTLSPYLPNALLHRKKEGFNAPMFSWASDPRFAKELQRELLHEPIPLFKELFNLNKLSKWLAISSKGHIVAETIYNLYFFSCWYRYHIEVK